MLTGPAHLFCIAGLDKWTILLNGTPDKRGESAITARARPSAAFSIQFFGAHGVIVAYRNGKPTASLANGISIRLDRFDMELAVELGGSGQIRSRRGLLPGAPAQRYFAVELVGGTGDD